MSPSQDLQGLSVGVQRHQLEKFIHVWLDRRQMQHVVSHLLQINYLAIIAFSAFTLLVGHQEEHTACKKLSDDELLWLSVWSEVQMICIWSSWCHCHPIISCFIKIQIGLTFQLLAYPGCPGKESAKWVSVGLAWHVPGWPSYRPVEDGWHY